MSAIPQAITPNPHTNLLNVYRQIANKMGVLTKKNCYAPSTKSGIFAQGTKCETSKETLLFTSRVNNT
jgi:hypothetical protein